MDPLTLTLLLVLALRAQPDLPGLLLQASDLPLDAAPVWAGGALLVAVAFWREWIVPGPAYARQVARADKAERALEERVLPALIDATNVLAYYIPDRRSSAPQEAP
jgi:hypothetical protein